jgi:hypothetical protein
LTLSDNGRVKAGVRGIALELGEVILRFDILDNWNPMLLLFFQTNKCKN